MSDPKEKQLSMYFWAPRDVPSQFLDLIPNVGEDGWVAYIPSESMDESVNSFIKSSPSVVMISLPDGGALFAGTAETYALVDPTKALSEASKNVRR